MASTFFALIQYTGRTVYTRQNVSAFCTFREANTKKATEYCLNRTLQKGTICGFFVLTSWHSSFKLSVLRHLNYETKSKRRSHQTQKEEHLLFFSLSCYISLSSCWNHYYRWLIFGIKSIKNQFHLKMKRKKAPHRHCGWLLLRHDK